MEINIWWVLTGFFGIFEMIAVIKEVPYMVITFGSSTLICLFLALENELFTGNK